MNKKTKEESKQQIEENENHKKYQQKEFLKKNKKFMNREWIKERKKIVRTSSQARYIVIYLWDVSFHLKKNTIISFFAKVGYQNFMIFVRIQLYRIA